MALHKIGIDHLNSPRTTHPHLLEVRVNPSRRPMGRLGVSHDLVFLASPVFSEDSFSTRAIGDELSCPDRYSQ